MALTELTADCRRDCLCVLTRAHVCLSERLENLRLHFLSDADA